MKSQTLLIVSSGVYAERVQQQVDPEMKRIIVIKCDFGVIMGRRFSSVMITRDALLEMSVPALSSEVFVENAQRWLNDHVRSRLDVGGKIVHI